jgi:ABC-2 type transport system permease protein
MGTRLIAAALADFMAGSIVPLPFFPRYFRAVAELLPFAAMQNTPLRVYSGHIAGAAAAWSIGLQIFWLSAFVLTGRLTMQKALRKVVVQGG